MKLLKQNIFKIVLSLMLVYFGSCSKLTLDELSIDPNNPTNADYGLLLTSAQSDISSGFGTNWDRYAGAFVQTFAGNHATGVNADRYILTANDFEGSFTSRYVNGFKDCEAIIRLASKDNNWQHVAVAKIMLATGLGHLTDVYGDIPYSDAFKGSSTAYPKYDTQENIYKTINTLLTESILDIDKTSITTLGKSDVIFAGDKNKWKMTANLLLARYSNHQSKLNAAQSATETLKYVDAALALNTKTDFTFNYDGTTNWRNPWYVLYENNLIIASKKFMDLLTTTNDPRKRAYWDNKPFNYPNTGGVLGFVGKPNGDPTGSASFSPVGPQTYYGKKASPILIATYFELKFIEAEAAFRANNKNRAFAALNEAVKTQLNLVTPTVEGLVTSENGDLAAYKKTVTDYITKYASETASTITLEKIMTEKYKAMFTMNVETWTDLRRHDFKYPANYLKLPNSASLTEFIRRGLYPQSEITTNAANVPKGVKMTDRLWWDKK